MSNLEFAYLPNSFCPKCGGALLIVDKRNSNAKFWARNPQEILCVNSQKCDFRRKVTEDDRKALTQNTSCLEGSSLSFVY